MAEALTDPLFVLAPPRSCTSVVGTMLGQHPQMYGLPETHLFACASMAEWWKACDTQSWRREQGLLRATAELFFGKQTKTTVRQAYGWLRRRSHFTTGMLMETLAARVYPLIVVDKSPSVVYSVAFLNRLHDLFPRARYIHLLRHPRAQGESIFKLMKFLEQKQHARVNASHPQSWLLDLCRFPSPSSPPSEMSGRKRQLDPQTAWYALNSNIDKFLKALPCEQKLRIRGEELLHAPDEPLRRIAGWMGLRADEDAIDSMKHPECSPYACFGPPGARCGNDFFFLKSPALHATDSKPYTLEGPLSWREDREGFLPEVKALAREYGYD